MPNAPALAGTGSIASGQTVDGIQCQGGEQTLFHIHAHLTVFVDGAPRQIPYGIGIPNPKLQTTPQGPFVASDRSPAPTSSPASSKTPWGWSVTGSRIPPTGSRSCSVPVGCCLVGCRKTALEGGPGRLAEEVMEPGLSTTRPDTPPAGLLAKLHDADLTLAVLTDPEGRLLGIVRRGDLEGR